VMTAIPEMRPIWSTNRFAIYGPATSGSIRAC
jgi:hypothetical protein